MIRLLLRPSDTRMWRVMGPTQADAEAHPYSGDNVWTSYSFDGAYDMHWYYRNAPEDFRRTIGSATFEVGLVSGITEVQGISIVIAVSRSQLPPSFVSRFALMDDGGLDIGACYDALADSGVMPNFYDDASYGLIGETSFVASLSGPRNVGDSLVLASWSEILPSEGEEEYGANYVYLDLLVDVGRLATWPENAGDDRADVLETRLTDVGEMAAILALLGAPGEALQLSRMKKVSLLDGAYDESGYYGVALSGDVPKYGIDWLDPWTVKVDLESDAELLRKSYGGVVLQCGDVPVAYGEFRQPTLGELTRRSMPVELRLRLDRHHLTAVGAFIVLSSLLSQYAVGVAGERQIELYDRDPRDGLPVTRLARNADGVWAPGWFLRMERGLFANSREIPMISEVSSGMKVGTHLGLKIGDELALVVPLAEPVMVTSRTQLTIPHGMLTLRMT